ncbi:MAG: cupredoxin domain-containing protein [Thermoleophilia bacterium]
MRVRRSRAAGCALLAAAVAAAGLTAAATGATAPAKRTLTASGKSLAFSTKTLRAPAGQVKLVLTNRSATFRHDIAIKGNGIAERRGPNVGKGGVSTVTVRLAPGRYTYFCTVGSHEKNGMKGTLTVTRAR